ncbi:efflux RND transporter periplasmic adaptor subunit [Prolixibacteraceae bacterium JC049]|nr:efflux RND transporter periplasmic adaptor subunit [Prolixibacteraceae bacterium JC049]
MKRRKVIIVISLLAVIIVLSYLGMMGLMGMRPQPPKSAAVDLKRHVKVEKVKYSTVDSKVDASGRVVAGNEVALVAEVSGRLQKGDIVLRKGVSFQKGDMLGVVYKDEFELALKARKSRFLKIVSNLLPDLKIDYPKSYNTFVQFFNSIEMNATLPPMPEIKDNQLKVFLASRDFLNEYYNVLKDEKTLSRYTLYAPFNGVFTQVNSEVGSYVNPGAQLAKMIRTDRMEIEIPVISTFSHWIKRGDKVRLYSKEHHQEYMATVIYKSVFVDKGTQSQSIFAKITDKNAAPLLAGEYLDAQFFGKQIDEVMEIPRNAVFNFNEVFVVENDRLKKQVIEIVKQNDKTVLIRGLAEDTNLVIQALINARENMPVKMLFK